MVLSLKEKYDLIHSNDVRFAYRLAGDVVKKPETSVWMILLPILFVHHMFRVSQYKKSARSFAENILEPRQKALDKAYKEAAAGKSIFYTLDDYFPGVALSSKQEKILADRQIRVMRVLNEHYLAMLQAQGNSLKELIRSVYRSSGEYRRFLDRLTDSEKELNRYILEHFHSNEESRLVVKDMEKQCAILRKAEMTLFFRKSGAPA